MMYNLGFGVATSQNTVEGSSGGQGQTLFCRVVDIILDAFHPDYDKYGKSQAINGILYIPLTTPSNEDTANDLQFAYCGRTDIKTLPLKGEIVKLSINPTEERDANPNSKKTYWTEIIPIWNHPHHNAYPDIYQSGDDTNEFGPHFEEVSNVNPLQGFPGDVLIQGRHGQSLRMGGTKYNSNPWVDNSNNGKPITILRNGQVDSTNGVDNILEDINEDASSIYLTSDHTIELEQANTKVDAWSDTPVETNQFKGSQIILNSGRLIFNAKEEHILLSSNEGIGLNGNSISIDGEEYIGLDAKKIYLGKVALNREDEPVLLGQSTTDLLDDFLSQFEQLIKTIATMPPAPPAAIAKMLAISNAILPVIPSLKNRLNLLHSKKVYTE